MIQPVREQKPTEAVLMVRGSHAEKTKDPLHRTGASFRPTHCVRVVSFAHQWLPALGREREGIEPIPLTIDVKMTDPPTTSSTSFSGWLTSKPAIDREPVAGEGAASALAGWAKSYQGGQQAAKPSIDIEAGTSLIAATLTSTFKSISSTTSAALDSAAVTQQQYAYFFGFMGVGVLLVLLSFFVFLPMIILRPSKFAITFSLGSLMILVSLGFLRGWRNMMGGMMEKERVGPTALYVGSLVGTLWASLVAKSYLLSIGMVGVQVSMLVYYVVSMVPGGATGLRALAGGALGVAKKAVIG
jgi:hypothetical protein